MDEAKLHDFMGKLVGDMGAAAIRTANSMADGWFMKRCLDPGL